MSQKLSDLERVFTGIMGDLTIAVDVLKEYESKENFNDPDQSVRKQCIWRLCFFSIIVASKKYVDICTKYGKELNEYLPDLIEIKNYHQTKINQNTAIGDLRNHYVAHFQKEKKKEPHRVLDDTEVEMLFKKMIGTEGVGVFLDWICPGNINNTDFKSSLVGTITLMRDAISSKL